MTDVAELLDALVPPYEGTGDWGRVRRDAKLDRRPRRAAYRLAAVAALVAFVAGIVALWPAGGTGGSVLDRALAATGDGQVLHLVYESELPRTLVDLSTGERTEIRAQHEVWFDPQAGLRETERFDGVVQFDVFLAPDEISGHASAIYTSLGAGYREALDSGRAEVVGEDVFDGAPVYWIRIEDGHDVAVSQETFEPKAIRITQAGTPALTPIVSYETLDAGSAPLEAGSRYDTPERLGEPGGEIELGEASAVLGRAPVWVGESLHGFALDAVRELSLPSSDGVLQGLTLVYGSSGDMPHVQIDQAASVADGLTMLVGLRGYTPPQGTMLLAGNMGLLQSNGLIVSIQAHDEATAIDVARLLRPYSG